MAQDGAPPSCPERAPRQGVPEKSPTPIGLRIWMSGEESDAVCKEEAEQGPFSRLDAAREKLDAAIAKNETSEPIYTHGVPAAKNKPGKLQDLFE